MQKSRRGLRYDVRVPVSGFGGGGDVAWKDSEGGAHRRAKAGVRTREHDLLSHSFSSRFPWPTRCKKENRVSIAASRME